MTLFSLVFETPESFATAVGASSPPTMRHDAFTDVPVGNSVICDVHLSWLDECWRLRGKKVLNLPPQVMFDSGQEATWHYLNRATTNITMPKSGRVFSRIPIRLPLTYKVVREEHSWQGHGYTTDIAAGGLAFATENAITKGDKVVLSLRLSASTTVKLTGEVKWRREDPMAIGTGVRFKDLTAADHKPLRKMLWDIALTGNHQRYESTNYAEW